MKRSKKHKCRKEAAEKSIQAKKIKARGERRNLEHGRFSLEKELKDVAHQRRVDFACSNGTIGHPIVIVLRK